MSQPYQGAVEVTPDDVTRLNSTRGLYVGTTGAIAVTMSDGTTVVFTGVPAGALLPISVIQVLETGTDADTILALY